MDTQGSASVAIGNEALSTQNFTSATDTYNTGVGDQAGKSVTTGIRNTLIGGIAGDALTDADYNTAVGMGALSSDTLGSRSTAIGQSALNAQNFTTATNTYNTAVGAFAGQSVTTGKFNTLVGAEAGEALTTGQSNHFIGYGAGGGVVGGTATQGNHNIGIGYNTFVESVVLTTGSHNIAIGNFSRTTAVDSTYATVIGYNVGGAAGYTTIGRDASDIRAAHGVATWSTVSDERYKKDIVDSEAGLSFINALRPRTFKYKNLGELPETFSAYKADSTEVFKNSNTNHGFIAQEVKAAIDADNSIKDGFTLWDDREDGSQEIAEAALIPVLTKAIQELSAQVDALTARIETLEG